MVTLCSEAAVDQVLTHRTSGPCGGGAGQWSMQYSGASLLLKLQISEYKDGNSEEGEQ